MKKVLTITGLAVMLALTGCGATVDVTAGYNENSPANQRYTELFHEGFIPCLKTRYEKYKSTKTRLSDLEYQLIVSSCNDYANDYASSKRFAESIEIK